MTSLCTWLAMRYANDKRCTLVIMDDANTDLTKDTGRDLSQSQRMLTDLGLVSAAQSRWKAASLHFKPTMAKRYTSRRKLIRSWSLSAVFARCRRSVSRHPMAS